MIYGVVKDKELKNMHRKSNENKESAQLLSMNNHYNSAVHCAYYCCFQLMISINPESKTFSSGKSSHEKTINYFLKEITDKKRLLSYDFKMNIKKLKDARDIADYKKETISEKECSSCIESSLKVVTILQKTFNLDQ